MVWGRRWIEEGIPSLDPVSILFLLPVNWLWGTLLVLHLDHANRVSVTTSRLDDEWGIEIIPEGLGYIRHIAGVVGRNFAGEDSRSCQEKSQYLVPEGMRCVCGKQHLMANPGCQLYCPSSLNPTNG